jgi:predicted nucleic acid-binding protein
VRVLIDTSVIVAGVDAAHAHHSVSAAWLHAMKAGAVTAVVSAHTLAEVYAVLTRIPARRPLAPLDVWRVIRRNILDVPGCSLFALTADEYANLIQRLAQAGHAGGITYDALVVEVARVEGVDHIVTLNTKHFSRLAPQASLVVSPLDQAPPK